MKIEWDFALPKLDPEVLEHGGRTELGLGHLELQLAQLFQRHPVGSIGEGGVGFGLFTTGGSLAMPRCQGSFASQAGGLPDSSSRGLSEAIPPERSPKSPVDPAGVALRGIPPGSVTSVLRETWTIDGPIPER